MIFGEFDGLGFGIEHHDAIIPAWQPGGANIAPVGFRPVILTFK